MGIDIYRIKSSGNLIKINSEILDLFYPEFAVETVEVSIDRRSLQELINTEKNIERKEILKEILDEFENEDVCDFIIG